MKIHEFVHLAKHVSEDEIDIMSEMPDANLIMRREKSQTNKREFRELLKRMRLLTTEQRDCLVTVDAPGQRQLAFLGICKAYPIIRDFVIEVVREKYVMLDFILSDADYQTFINRKSELHEELSDFSVATIKKGRQVIWRILEQAGIINNTTERRIVPQFVNPEVVHTIRNEDPGLLRIFLLSDNEIKDLIR